MMKKEKGKKMLYYVEDDCNEEELQYVLETTTIDSGRGIIPER